MNGMNGHRLLNISTMVMASVDSLIMIMGIIIGGYIKFQEMNAFLEMPHIVLRIMMIVFVTQIIFYYFDLYDFKVFRSKKRMVLLLFESVGISSILLGVISFMAPFLALGRDILLMGLFIMFFLSGIWRILLGRVCNTRAFREKILIVGTGDLAKRIGREIFESGSSFEIVGFIDENPNKIGKQI